MNSDSRSVNSDLTSENMSQTNLLRFKTVFIGDVAVGKTSIVCRLNESKFRENYEPSIGVDFSSKSIKFRGKTIKFQIWDSAGQEKYKSLIPSYIKGSSIVFIVFDVTSKKY